MTSSQPAAHHRQTARGAVVLAGVAATVAGVALARGDGSPSWARAVAFSGTICCGASLAGWLLARRPPRGPATAVANALAGVVVRIMVPLAALGWLQASGSRLQAAGADRLLLIFYLSLLATDIVLHMMERSRFGRSCGGNTAN